MHARFWCIQLISQPMHHTMYHCSTRSSKCYHSVKVSVSYPDWAIRSSRQGIKHIPTYWFRTGYLYIFLNPRLKRTGAWNTEDWVGGEHYFAVHFFAQFAFFFVICVLFSSFPFFLIFFYMAPGVSEVQSGAEKFSFQYGPVSGFGLATAEAERV